MEWATVWEFVLGNLSIVLRPHSVNAWDVNMFGEKRLQITRMPTFCRGGSLGFRLPIQLS